MAKYRVVIYTKPECTLCKECRYAFQVELDGEEGMICKRNYLGNDGHYCKKMLPDDPEEIYEP